MWHSTYRWGGDGKPKQNGDSETGSKARERLLPAGSAHKARHDAYSSLIFCSVSNMKEVVDRGDKWQNGRDISAN